MSSRSYAEAVDKLNSLQSNAATLEALRASGGRSSALAHPEMIEYLERIGYRIEDLNPLNVIHITGTKGKGSTSAFTDSILRQVKPDWTVGLYTSPHLVAVRERIRVNGSPISEDLFTKYFFEVWERLEKTNAVKAERPMPGYFRYMTLMAFHTFTSLKVDATILEVGVGGTYDSTNIVPKPIVTGITALGLDHTLVLGKTIKEIAWQKGGIYKPGVPAFTVNQVPEGMEMLRHRASELQASKFVVTGPMPGLSDLRLGLAGSHQLQNATLAMHLVHEFFTHSADAPVLTDEFARGLEEARWPGRCQTVQDPSQPRLTWFLDGAHTVESLEYCIQWFVSPTASLRTTSSPKPSRVFIFNCTNGRSGSSFLGTVLSMINAQLKLHGYSESAATFFDHVIFCANVTYADGAFKGDLTTKAIPEDDLNHLKTQRELASAWTNLAPDFPADKVHVLPSIEHTVKIVRELRSTTTNVDVLVAGSLHLVGGIIEVAGLSSVAL